MPTSHFNYLIFKACPPFPFFSIPLECVLKTLKQTFKWASRKRQWARLHCFCAMWKGLISKNLFIAQFYLTVNWRGFQSIFNSNLEWHDFIVITFIVFFTFCLPPSFRLVVFDPIEWDMLFQEAKLDGFLS